MALEIQQTYADQIDAKDAFNFLFFVEAMNSPLNLFSSQWNRDPSKQIYSHQQPHSVRNVFDNSMRDNFDPRRSNVEVQDGHDFKDLQVENAEYKMLTCKSFQEFLQEDNNSFLLSLEDNSSNNNDCNIDDDRNFSCKICGKTFKRRSSLSTHKLIHDNIKPYVCSVCRKDFLRRSDLKKHTLMHTGQKPHQCSECGRVFSQSSNMLTHMRRHSGVRPYSCQICGNSFYRKVDVRRHQAKHLRDDESLVMGHRS